MSKFLHEFDRPSFQGSISPSDALPQKAKDKATFKTAPNESSANATASTSGPTPTITKDYLLSAVDGKF